MIAYYIYLQNWKCAFSSFFCIHLHKNWVFSRFSGYLLKVPLMHHFLWYLHSPHFINKIVFTIHKFTTNENLRSIRLSLLWYLFYYLFQNVAHFRAFFLHRIGILQALWYQYPTQRLSRSIFYFHNFHNFHVWLTEHERNQPIWMINFNHSVCLCHFTRMLESMWRKEKCSLTDVLINIMIQVVKTPWVKYRFF